MVADGNVLVVRQQRVVGPEHLADVGRVVDADVEVSVVADAGGQVHGAVWRRDAASGRAALEPAALAAVGIQDFREARPECLARRRSERKQARSANPRTPPLRRPAHRGRTAPTPMPRPGRRSCCRSRHRRTPFRSARRAEDAEGQVLNGEVFVTVGGAHPALPLWIVGLIELRHRPA